MSINFSDKRTLFGIIGGGGALLLPLCLGSVLCCRTKKNDSGEGIKAHEDLEVGRYDPIITSPRLETHSTAHVRVPLTIDALQHDPFIVTTRVSYETIALNSCICENGLVQVFKGTYRGNVVAVKKLLPHGRRSAACVKLFFLEIRLMAQLRHERVVTFIGVAWNTPKDVCAVTEFMEGGNLREMLTRIDEEKPRAQGIDKHKAVLAVHIAQALAFMHSLQPPVMHKDLNSSHVLLDRTQTSAKLTHVGAVRELDDRSYAGKIQAARSKAPEVMKGHRGDEKSDVFSFGVMLSELDTHQIPYADIKEKMASGADRPAPEAELLRQIATGRVSVTFSSDLYENLRVLGQACVAVDPRERPTAAQVLSELLHVVHAMESEYVL